MDKMLELKDILSKMFPKDGDNNLRHIDSLEEYSLQDIVKMLFEIKTIDEFRSHTKGDDDARCAVVEDGGHARRCAKFLYDTLTFECKDLAEANSTLNGRNKFSKWMAGDNSEESQHIGNEFMEFLNGCIDPHSACSPDKLQIKGYIRASQAANGGQMDNEFEDVLKDRFGYNSEDEEAGEETAGGYLYVFTDEFQKKNRRYKIGSARDPLKRLVQLRTGNIDLKFVAMYPPFRKGPVDHHLNREKHVHKSLDVYRIKGGFHGPREWYKGKDADPLDINKIMQEFESACTFNIQPA